MSEEALELIVLADSHYVGKARHDCGIAARQAELGLELIQRALRREAICGSADAIVLLGDLVDDGDADGAEEDLKAIRDLVARAELPTIAVPGNHDGDGQRLLSFFGDRPGPHELKGMTLYSFADRYDDKNECRRDPRDLEALAAYAAEHPGRTIVALQHNVVHPPIPSDYPYNFTNTEAVVQAYEKAGVALSLSAHYHAGHAPAAVGGVAYAVAPALSEAPFRFLRVRLRGREASIAEESLTAPAPLCDVHIHTEFAYCGNGIRAETAIARAQLFGLAGIALTEHSDQLYLTAADFASRRIIAEPDLPRTMRQAGRDRFAGYRALTEPLRSPFVRIGLEVECNSRFEPILLEEDRAGWDLLLGGVHWMTDGMVRRAGGTVEGAFMKLNEALLDAGVKVLAHPFRYFQKHGLAEPRELYRPLARMLAERGVAAEVNFHTNLPDPEFFAICLAEGVRIALGSDSHEPHEVGELGPHLELLRSAGAGAADLPRILCRL